VRAVQDAEADMSQTGQDSTILIVEDQEILRNTLGEYLRTVYPQATVLEAADGAQALHLCRSADPRLVLMDVALPDANGIDLTVTIMKTLPQTKVIVVSQYADQAYQEGARAAGAFAYVPKDKIYRDLLPALKRAWPGGLQIVDMGASRDV
jgi:DNA-binding NarL/FixJ family response regulator